MSNKLKVLVVKELPSNSENHYGNTYWVQDDFCKCGHKNLQRLNKLGPYYGDSFTGYGWQPVYHNCIAYLGQRILELENEIRELKDARTTD